MATLKFRRCPLEPLDRDRRNVRDWVALRFPGAIRRVSASVLRLPLGSRLRRAMISLSFREGFAASNRGDYDRQFLQYARDAEIHIEDPGWRAVDLAEVYEGRDGARQLVEDLRGPFEQLRWEPLEVIDAGGGRIACRLEVVGVGRASRLETRQEQWHAYMIDQGLIVRQRVFSTEEEALGALAETAQTPRPASNQP